MEKLKPNNKRIVDKKMEARGPKLMQFERNLKANYHILKQAPKIYLLATNKNDKIDKKKVAILLNYIGKEGIEILKTLSSM